MIAKIPRIADAEMTPSAAAQNSQVSLVSRSLLDVLWRRRWLVALTALLFLSLATTYLFIATPIYTSSSSVSIEQSNNKILSDSQGVVAKSDSLLYTQAQVLKSAPIIVEALKSLDWHNMQTFSQVTDPEIVDFFQTGSAYKVDVGKKDDIVTVSMDSAVPAEAAAVVNAIVTAYISHQSTWKRTTAGEILKVLQKEKLDRDSELQAATNKLVDYKHVHEALSYATDRGNLVLDQLGTLSNALIAAKQDTADVTLRKAAAEEALRDPQKTKYFIQSLILKSMYGDRDYDALQEELRKYELDLATSRLTSGESSKPVAALKEDVAMLKASIAAKEKLIAVAGVAQAELDLGVAKEKERQMEAAVAAQQAKAIDLNAKLVESSQMDLDVQRLQKQSDYLDGRIKEVSVNSEDTGALQIQVLEPAVAEAKPSKPRKSLVLAVGLLGGLMVGSGLALVREYADQRFRDPDEVAALLQLPILGVVPHMLGKLTVPMRGQIVRHQNLSDVAEAYRTVRTALYFGGPEKAKTIVVTSPSPGDGKSTTASNLAIAMAQSGNRTILIDCDFRKPTQHRIHEIGDQIGFSSVLSGESKMPPAIKQTAVPNLYVLPCGPTPENPSEVLTGKRFEQAIAAIAKVFDKVIIDSPPVLAVADAQILAARADRVVLVARTNKSTRRASLDAVESLRSVGAYISGVVVNDVARQKGHYGYYGNYSYGGEPKGKASKKGLAFQNGSAKAANGRGVNTPHVASAALMNGSAITVEQGDVN